MGRCFTFNGNKDNVLTTESTGNNVGNMLLTLNAQPEEYYRTDLSSERVGFRIEIHHPGDKPQISRHGYDISPGFYHNLAVTRKKVSVYLRVRKFQFLFCLQIHTCAGDANEKC